MPPPISDLTEGLPESVAQVVRHLNDALARDPVAIFALLQVRVPCNESLAEHPTVVVEEMPRSSDSPSFDGHGDMVGPLGLLNCVCAVATGYRITSLWSDPVGEEERRALVGFGARKSPT